ncbi:MAG TPA: DUF2214 family protein [Candidatus Baltobacteraceae bacterium]|nr:DUF2214 family protein [Candidatus Baltobacteraceae bacterium]
MLLDVVLAWLHFLCIFFLVSTLVAELVLYRQRMDRFRLEQLRRVDTLFGISAVLVIISGILRVTLGLKGAAFYMHNPFFWTKMALFLAVGLLSIPPTVHYLRLKPASDGAGSVEIPPRAFRATWTFLSCEIVLLALIPFFATMLAHGYQ